MPFAFVEPARQLHPNELTFLVTLMFVRVGPTTDHLCGRGQRYNSFPFRPSWRGSVLLVAAGERDEVVRQM
jgi:hypothetical protein